MKINFKSLLPHIVSILVFVIVSSIYFSPVFEGYSLKQNDIRQHKGMSKEIDDFRITHGKEPLWTNSMFGGMPAYQISTKYENNLLAKVNLMFQLGLPHPVGLLFLAMLGFYIFGLCLKVNPWLSMLGGLAFGLSTINLLYIGAGHNSKVNAIAYMAPALGGFILAFRGRLMLGAAIFGLFFGLNITCNHFQMTYYLVFLLGAVGIVEVIRLSLQKSFVELGKAVGVLLIAGGIGVLPGIGNITSTLEYSKYTTRGATDLTITPKGENNEQRVAEGLNTNYILEYNYGKGEILSIIAPNAKGAKDDLIANDEKAMENVDPQFSGQISQMNHYWGGQRMSGGAFYFGVVMFAFFLFGMVYYKDPIKWAFLAIVLLAMALASKDPGGLNNIFINKVPMYNKFRDSKMILVLIQVIFPALGILFLNYLLERKEEIVNKKKLLITTGSILLFGIVLYMFPSVSGSFMRSEEIGQFDEAMKSVKDPTQLTMFTQMKQALIETRISIYKSEIGRTLLLLAVGSGIVLLFFLTRINRMILTVVSIVFVFGDNLSVSKRYLNNDGDGMHYNSYEEETVASLPYVPQASDISILNREKVNISGFEAKKGSLLSQMKLSSSYETMENQGSLETIADFGTLNMNTDYRVLTFANPFNETGTSYFHKSIGGYHGAKLKRYQEMIDFYISDEMMKLNQIVSAEKNRKLREYSAVMEITQDKAQAVFDTISVSDITLPDSMPVLNMLNVKYLIVNPAQSALMNHGANGNAWFVKDVLKANSTNEEMSKLKSINSKNQAVINKEFAAAVSAPSLDSTSTIKLLKYDVNTINYLSSSNVKATAVFSEIWYPEGWNCYVDGKKIESLRANYVLRAAVIPAGKHTVSWKFEPKAYYQSETLALIGSFGLIGGCIFIFGFSLKKNEEDAI